MLTLAADAITPWDPALQYGALGLCGVLLYGLYRLLNWFLERDKERETRLVQAISEHQAYTREQAKEIHAIAVASVKAIENFNDNSSRTTRILENLERRMGSSDRWPATGRQGG